MTRRSKPPLRPLRSRKQLTRVLRHKLVILVVKRPECCLVPMTFERGVPFVDVRRREQVHIAFGEQDPVSRHARKYGFSPAAQALSISESTSANEVSSLISCGVLVGQRLDKRGHSVQYGQF